ncbi:hypothetical protein ACWFNE_09260 [Cellulomonas sp. NPDC055163]
MNDPDRTLIETTRTHRDRLASALSFGALDRRRPVNTNLRRFVGSVVLAAVAGVGCLTFSLVVHLLDDRRQDQALAAFRAALSANPIQPTDQMPEDPLTGFLEDPASEDLVDPQTGFVVDRETGLARDPEGNTIDPRIDWYLDPATGYYTDPATGVTIDPRTLQVVEEDR